MFHALRGGSWQLGTRPASDKERQQRQALPSPPARPHPPAMRHRRQPQGWVRFRRLVAVFNARCWLLTGTGSGAPPLVEDSAPQRLQPSRHSRSRGPRPCCGGSQAPSADGLEPTLERDRKVQSPPRGRKRTRAAHGLPALAVPATGAGRLPTRPGGASPLLVSQAGPLQGPMNPPSLSLHILTSLVKFILWNSGRA